MLVTENSTVYFALKDPKSQDKIYDFLTVEQGDIFVKITCLNQEDLFSNYCEGFLKLTGHILQRVILHSGKRAIFTDSAIN